MSLLASRPSNSLQPTGARAPASDRRLRLACSVSDKTRRPRFAAFVALAAATAMASGCCLTPKLWENEAVRPRPAWLNAASYDDVEGLIVDLTYSNGRQRQVEYAPDRVKQALRDWSEPTTANFESSVERAHAGPYEVARSGMAILYRTEFESGILYLPRPVDWSGPAPYLAVVGTPFTAVVDIVTAPIHVLWVAVTVGGHGQPWVFWCDN